MDKHLKHILSVISFLCAIVIGFIALFLPPLAIIDSSVLWFTAQLLVFTSGLLGIDMNIQHLQGAFTRGGKDRHDMTDKERVEINNIEGD